jgi:uncharacterized protein (DUF433 family)
MSDVTVTAPGFYTTREAARLAKVPRSTVRYWAQTRLIEPSQRRGRLGLYSFADLRDLVVCRQLKEQGAHVQAIRRALDHVREVEHAERLSHANFAVTYSGAIVYEEDGLIQADRRGQRVFWVRLKEAYEELGGTLRAAEVREFRPRDRVTINPEVRGGAPVVAGTRIPTRLISELVREEGLEPQQVIELYPSLSHEDIKDALAFESESGLQAEAGSG